MTILNNDLLGNYLQIQSVLVNFTDLISANTLTASIIDDNLENSSVVRYNLYNLIIDESGNSAIQLYTNTLVITGEDYLNWSGDSTFVYTYIASKIPIILL